MKHVILAVVTMIASTNAFADGFVCHSDDGLTVKAFNQVQPEVGTRNAAVMILSDDSVGAGRKTIAKFEADETLANTGASYEARVDLRYNNSGRKGELLAGTKLGYVKTIALDVDFSYAAPQSNGSHVDGLLTIAKRDGSEIRVNMDCARYLKN